MIEMMPLSRSRKKKKPEADRAAPGWAPKRERSSHNNQAPGITLSSNHQNHLIYRKPGRECRQGIASPSHRRQCRPPAARSRTEGATSTAASPARRSIARAARRVMREREQEAAGSRQVLGWRARAGHEHAPAVGEHEVHRQALLAERAIELWRHHGIGFPLLHPALRELG